MPVEGWDYRMSVGSFFPGKVTGMVVWPGSSMEPRPYGLSRGAGYRVVIFTDLVNRLQDQLVPFQLTSPSDEASPQGAPCPRSRDGLPDRDDVSRNVRQVPAQWGAALGIHACTHLRWVPGSFLGPAQCPTKLERNSWRSTSEGFGRDRRKVFAPFGQD